MKNIFSLLLLLLPCTFALAADPQPVVSVVKEVTIFQNGAQVTRTGTHRVSAGRSELVFKDLSTHILEKSIQLKAEGEITIMSVRFQMNYLEAAGKQGEIKSLETEYEALADRIARLNNDLTVLKQDEALLAKNQVQVVGVQNNPVKTQDLRELADFQRERLSQVLTQQYEIALQIKELGTKAEAVKKQLEALNAQKFTPSGEIRVVVNAERAVNANFTLSYYATPAGWEPVYDIRVKDVNSPVALFQKANLYQQTGENWSDVKLSLSTGNPTENGARPQLMPWRLRYVSPYARSRAPVIESRYTITGRGLQGELRGKVIGSDGEPLIGAAIVAAGTPVGAVTDFNGDFALRCPSGATAFLVSYTGYNAASLPGNLCGQVVEVILSESSAQLQEVVVTGYGGVRRQKKEDKYEEEEEDNGPPVTVVELPTTLLYEIDVPVTLPSDGQLQLVDIQDYALPAQYRYQCVPKLDLNAYLSARVTGWEALGLLSGDANLFFEGTYLGKTRLEFNGTSDTMEISLGKDRNISVTRTKLKEYSKRQFLSNRKEDSRQFEIAVKNKKAQTITLVVEDQFPVSTSKNITVERTETGNAEVDETAGKLTWNLTLAPAEDKKFKFGYKVKYPRERILVLE